MTYIHTHTPAQTLHTQTHTHKYSFHTMSNAQKAIYILRKIIDIMSTKTCIIYIDMCIYRIY